LILCAFTAVFSYNIYIQIDRRDKIGKKGHSFVRKPKRKFLSCRVTSHIPDNGSYQMIAPPSTFLLFADLEIYQSEELFRIKFDFVLSCGDK